MTSSTVIHVPLPESPPPSAEDLDVLRTMFQAIVTTRCERGQEWRRVLARLRAAGWEVEYGLRWHVVARRGRELEEACGYTRDEAFAKVDHVTRTDVLEGTP